VVRREALVAKFRSTARERLARVARALLELQEGGGAPEAVTTLSRELHTLKGEGRMLGFARLAEVVHEAENVLAAAREVDDRLGPGTCARLRSALPDLEEAVLADGEEPVRAALDRAQAKLRGGVTVPPDAGVPAPAPAPLKPEERPVGRERWVQVNAATVDTLVEQLAGLNTGFQRMAFQFKGARDPAVEGGEVARALAEQFDRCRTQLAEITSGAWALRFLPVEPLLEQAGRHARELALDQGKRLKVVVEGAGAQLERNILDGMEEPLLHLVRNCVDHGVEPPGERGGKPEEALLGLRAETQGPNVVISVSDDGRGVDIRRVREVAVSRGLLGREAAEGLGEEAALDLLFLPGFSTRAHVSQLSGRGVGLSVVRHAVDALGGSLSVKTQPGAGTTFHLAIPAAITVERMLVLDAGGTLYAIPDRQVLEVRRRPDGEVETGQGAARTVRWGEEQMPARGLGRLLAGSDVREPFWLVVEWGARRVALAVPRIAGEFELVRRPVDRAVALNQQVGATATLDDGSLVLVLSLAGLFRRLDAPAPLVLEPTPLPRGVRVLVADDSPVVRDLVSGILAGAGYQVVTAADGRTALELLATREFNLALLDVDMPGMTGLQLAAEAQARWPGLPVVMLTARSSQEDRDRAARAGVKGYIVKRQFEESSLVEIIRQHV
jgi:chemotaxis protein histidine kinase CheA